MKTLKHTALLISLLLLLPACYQNQQLDYSKWYTVEAEDDPVPTEDIKVPFTEITRENAAQFR